MRGLRVAGINSEPSHPDNDESWEFLGSQGFGKPPNPCKTPSERADGETRTPNLLFTRQLRYRLRHASMMAIALGPRPSSHEG
jgi:hypothetical protein